ncbi:MAG: C39 family peptidase [Chloroflexi bacterium]|nr:C39 family peptidase [Chloroflexota bacterium]
MAGLIFSVLPGEDAAALPAPASPTATPRSSSQVRPAAANGNFITGTVWDDTRIRNGIIDDNEGPLETTNVVTISIERVDTPGVPVPCVGGADTPPNINPVDSTGRYRCNVPAPGAHRVTITVPSGFEATTPRQREVTTTATEGGVANFGLANLDQRIRTIAGVVFLDCNENGIRDLATEFDNNPPSGSFTVRLERTDGSNRITSRSTRYSFDNVDSGTYIVSLAINDSDVKATTSTRREVTIGSTFGAVVDFGLIGLNGNGACARAAQATATTAAATAVTVANRTATAIVRSGGQGLEPGQVPPAAATAIAAGATATAARFTPTPIPTPVPTATPIPTTRLASAYPRSARFLMQAVAKYPDGRRIDMLAEGALIGLETIVFQDAGQRVGSEQLSMRIKRNEQVDDIVVTAQDAYRQRQSDDFWRIVSYSEIRNELGLLAPLDAIVALRCISRGQDGGQAVVNGNVTRYILGDVDTMRFWETSIRPVYGTGGGGSSSSSAPTIAGGGGRTAQGRVIPSCTPPPQSRITPGEAIVEGAQPVYQSMQVEAWVGLEDGLIRSERMTARVLPPIGDPKRMPDPIEFDMVLTYSDVNLPITIIPPPVPTPTAIPPTAGPASQGAGQPAAVQPAPDNGRQSGLQAPTPGLPGFPTPETSEPPESVIEGGEQPAQPSNATPGQREQALAAERALVALATGGQPRTGSYARGNNIVLDIPFRTQLDNTNYAPTNSGPASLAMVLGGYGTNVAVSDLRALMNGLDGNYSPGATVRIETIARVAERGGLNVIDLYRGARFNEWTVEQVREMIRRGYPVATLVQGAVLPGGTPQGAARERFITIVGMDGDELIYHDPAYPDEGQGAARRIPGRLLEQGWLAASTPRLAAGFSLGPEGRGMLDSARSTEVGPGTPVASPSPDLQATVPVIATLEPTPTPPAPEYPFGLPVHPVLVLFWLILVVLLLVILVRSLR